MEIVLDKAILLAGELATKVIIKEVMIDSINQKNLICDLVKVDEDVESVYYENAAYVLGKQPFDLTDEQIAGLN